MRLEYVDTDNGLIESRIGGLNKLVVQVLLEIERCEADLDKLEQSAQVFWARGCHENVGVAIGDRTWTTLGFNLQRKLKTTNAPIFHEEKT